MHKLLLQFLLLSAVGLGALFLLHGLFEPSGGPELGATSKAPAPDEVADDKAPPVEDYTFHVYNNEGKLVATVRGKRFRFLGDPKIGKLEKVNPFELEDTELTLEQYGEKGSVVRRIKIRSPRAVGEYLNQGNDQPQAGSFRFTDSVSLTTSDGLVIRASALKCRFEQVADAEGAKDPITGWTWHFETTETVTVQGPGLLLEGKGLSGSRDDFRLLLHENPRAVIDRGLGEITEVRRFVKGQGRIAIRARGPLVLEAPGGAAVKEGGRLNIRFENDVFLTDYTRLSPGSPPESILSCRRLLTELTLDPAKPEKSSDRVSLNLVRAEGDVRYFNLSPMGDVEAAFSGAVVSFQGEEKAERVRFRVEGLPRALFRSSTSFTSGLLEDDRSFSPRGKRQGPENLIWIASDSTLDGRSTWKKISRRMKVSRIFISIPKGATLSSYLCRSEAPPGEWRLDLSGESSLQLPTLPALRKDFRPELVLTSQSMTATLGTVVGDPEEQKEKKKRDQPAFHIEQFSADGEAWLRDFNETGRMESACRSERMTLVEQASDSGKGFTRTVTLSGKPSLAFFRNAAWVPWGETLTLKDSNGLPTLFRLSCQGDIRHASSFSGRPSGQADQRSLTLHDQVVFHAYSRGKDGKIENLFTPDLAPHAAFSRHMSLRCGEADLLFRKAGETETGAPDLRQIHARKGVSFVGLNEQGHVLRQAKGDRFEWHVHRGPGGTWVEKGTLAGGTPAISFATLRQPLPFRSAPKEGLDWVSTQAEGTIGFQRDLTPVGKRSKPSAMRLALQKDVTVEAAPLSERGRRTEWRLRCEALDLALLPVQDKGRKVRWTPARMAAKGPVSFFNYSDEGSTEAWGRAGNILWEPGTPARPDLPRPWTLTLSGHPMVEFAASGRFMMEGKSIDAKTGSVKEPKTKREKIPRDFKARLEAREKISVTAHAPGTASEVIRIRARGGAVLLGTGTLAEKEGKTVIRMNSEGIQADVTQEKSPGERRPRRTVREAAGQGETLITQLNSDGSSGVYQGRDLVLNPLAGEGERRVYGPGKWTFKIVKNEK